jgi:hypothetical protein
LGYFYEAVRQKGWLGRFTLTLCVHDEFIAEVHESIPSGEALSFLKEIAVYGTQELCPSVTIYVGSAEDGYKAKLLDNWSQMK